MQGKLSEMRERKQISVAEVLRRRYVHPHALMHTDLPWVKDRDGLRTLGPAIKMDVLDVYAPGLGGILKVVVAEHVDGSRLHHVLMGIASDGVTTDDPRLAYHPFTSRHFAKTVRGLVEEDQRYKNIVRKAGGKEPLTRRFSIFDLMLPLSSVHGELIRRKLVGPSVTSTPVNIRAKIAWERFRVVRLEVPGIQNNVPVVVGTYRDNKGKTHQAAIGVAAAGNRQAGSSERCPAHHHLLDEKLAKLLQRLIYVPRPSRGKP